MKVQIKPSVATGKVYPPSSKSMAHRLLICAALCGGESVVSNVTFSEDILATLDCLKKMGAKYSIDDRTVVISGVDNFNFPSDEYFCRESGSTLRFLIPLLLLSENEQTLSGKGRLLERPQTVYENLCKEKGLTFLHGDKITLKGQLKSGKFVVRGDISSQFITGLLFALTVADGESVIEILPPFESASYINMTLEALDKFGADFETDELTIKIKGGKKLKPQKLSVEGDYSGSAFLDAFNYFGGEVECLGMNEKSLQGDKIYKHYFELLDYGSPVLDVSDCPDLAPVLMSVAAFKNGCRLTGTKRLKIKESDRGVVMAEELKKFGADTELFENEIIIHKTKLHQPKEVLFGHNDHRIVMALAVLCTAFGGIIDGAEAVSKSFPNFFETIKQLGIEVNIYADK